MAAGRWNHTAELAALQINLTRASAGVTELIRPLELHPYDEMSPTEKLAVEYAKRLKEISIKLPTDERPAARRELMKAYQEQLSRL